MKKSSGNYNNEDYPYVSSIIRLRLGQGVIPLVSECCRHFRNLESLIMHSSITISGTGCFRECESLEYVCLPNSISTIPADTFNGALAMKIIILPKEVTSVGGNAFRYAFGATAVCMNNKDVSYGSDVFHQNRGLRHIYIPDSQTIISSEMFKECNGIEEIIFSNSLITINNGAFATCTSITELNFPSTLNAINNSDAFSRCQALRKIRFNKATMSTLGTLSFAYCYCLKEVINLPEVTTYGVDIFRECYGLKELIPDSHMTAIPNGFVRGTTLEEFNIPSGVTSLGNYAFYNIDTLRNLVIPSGVTSIGEYCFGASNNLIELTLPSGLTSIPNNMCEDCYELKKVNIPNGVTVINGTAFNDCSALTEIIIPDSVTQIKGECFRYCYSLGMIKFEGSTPPTLNSSNCFGGLPTDCIIYVPAGSLSSYTSAQYYPSSSTYTYIEYPKTIYKWDFKGKSGTSITDDISGHTGNLSGATGIGDNGYSTDGFTRFDPLLTTSDLFVSGYSIRFKVKFGAFTSTSHSSGEKGRIFSFGTDMALYWNDVPMLYGSGVGGSYRLTALDNQFSLLENDELIVDLYNDGTDYKATWTFPDGTTIDYGTLGTGLSVILGEYQYTDNGLGGVYVEGLEIILMP